MTTLPKDYADPCYHNDDAARIALERIFWPYGPTCPTCGKIDTVTVYGQSKGKSMGPGWYWCSECREKFTVRVGTVFEKSHVPLHLWFQAAHLLMSSKKGISSNQLHRTLGVTLKTAWFMSHRLREAMRISGARNMGGDGKVVEADETFIGRLA